MPYSLKNSFSSCPRCFGSGFESVIGKGSRKCSHKEFTKKELKEREAAAFAFKKRCEALRDAPEVPPIPRVHIKQPGEDLEDRPLVCCNCGREVSTAGGYNAGDVCGIALDDEAFRPRRCKGTFISLPIEEEVAL